MGAKKELDVATKDLITLDECVKRLQDLWKLERAPYSRKTLQNRISANVYRRYGPPRFPMVDWDEVRTKEIKKNG